MEQHIRECLSSLVNTCSTDSPTPWSTVIWSTVLLSEMIFYLILSVYQQKYFTGTTPSSQDVIRRRGPWQSLRKMENGKEEQIMEMVVFTLDVRINEFNDDINFLINLENMYVAK